MRFFQLGLLKNEALLHPERSLRARRISGFSLIELLLLITAVGFLVILIGSLPNSIQLIGRSKHQSIVREIIAKQIEDKRAVTYINLTPGETSITDQRLSLLPEGSGKTLIEECDASICQNSEGVKQITVTVTWKEAGKLQTTKIKTLIAEGGLNQ